MKEKQSNVGKVHVFINQMISTIKSPLENHTAVISLLEIVNNEYPRHLNWDTNLGRTIVSLMSYSLRYRDKCDIVTWWGSTKTVESLPGEAMARPSTTNTD